MKYLLVLLNSCLIVTEKDFDYNKQFIIKTVVKDKKWLLCSTDTLNRVFSRAGNLLF